MPRKAAGLTAIKVRTVGPGRYGDGGGLYLLVRSVEAKFWLFRYMHAGKAREMGLGPATGPNAVSLAEARVRARKLHDVVRNGRDPLADRQAEAAARAAEQAARAGVKTFAEATGLYLAAQEAGWRSRRYPANVRHSLETYAFPHMGALPVAEVETSHVMAALEPIWRTKTDTANRLRGRIESVLDYAKARGWRTGENPARWRGHVANMLPAPRRVRKTKHHAALPWPEMAGFMEVLRADPCMASHALRFTILTAARTGEALGARWSEIDLGARLWTIPAARMKAGLEHRVPLSPAALAVVEGLAPLRPVAGDGHVFPSLRTGGGRLTAMTMMELVRRRRADITVHGFRSSFRDWAAEATDHAREVVEAALAHQVENKVEAAYRRGDLLEKRRRLMDEWAGFCMPAVGEVVALRAA